MAAARKGRLAALAAGALALAACTTTHELGRFGEPETMAALEGAARSGPLQLVIPFESKHFQGSRRYRVTSIGPEGLRWERTPGEPELIPPASVGSVSTFGAGRGALEGALIAGPSAFVLASLIGGLLVIDAEPCGENCSARNAGLGTALKVSALVGLAATAIGAGFGGYYGHEHRYVIAR